MRFVSIAAIALLGLSVQVHAANMSAIPVSTDNDAIMTRVSVDGQTAQVQQANGEWTTIKTVEVANDQVVATDANAKTEVAQFFWGGHHGWGGHMWWGHHWYHAHHHWDGGDGYHYHYWHRNWWGGGWHHHHGWWRHHWG